MKKIISLSIFLGALIFASSCVKEEDGGDPFTREASLVAGVSSKTVLDGNAVRWKDGDKISVVFTHPQKGANVAEFSTEIEGGGTAEVARFLGRLPLDLNAEGGYAHEGFAVHPSTAVNQDGVPAYTLPVEQVAEANGAFTPGMNLSSAIVELSDINAGKESGVSFRNALSIIRFKLTSDVTSVTFEGTSPFAGQVPLVFSEEGDGRLVVDTKNLGSAGSRSVTLKPAAGAAGFTDNVVYNLLVWPGSHSSLTIKLNFKTIGEYRKVSAPAAGFVFDAAKFYTLGFKAGEELVLEEIDGNLDAYVSNLADMAGRIEDAEESVGTLLSQIQSVATMPEYAENVAMAPYSVYGSSKQKDEITVRYMVRPASVAEELASSYSSAMSAQVCYRNTDGGMSFATLPVSGVELAGDIMSVSVNAEGLSNSFYDGNTEAQLALHISDGTTEILSDFIGLVPKLGAGLNIRNVSDIPVLKGASVSIPFSYAPTSDTYTLSVSAEGIDASAAGITYYDISKTGFINLNVKESDNISAIRIKVKLTSGEDVIEQPLTFAEGGRFDVEVSGEVDYVGGEVSLKVTENTLGSYQMQLNTGGWIYQTHTGVNGHYTVDYNGGEARTASVSFSIHAGGMTYTKYVSVIQKANGAPLQGDYYNDADYLQLQTGKAKYMPLNVVILGDGYKKKDLLKNGKFERNARSAMDSFFGVAPLKDFRDRFNVFMVAYESENEGPRLETTPANDHKTCFETYYKGGGNTYVNYSDAGKNKVVDVVQKTLGLTGTAYFRTVVILLVNTSENIGSTNYPEQSANGVWLTGDGYATFSIAMVAANSTSTGSLIMHEACGHGFGRLGDEYNVDWYTPELVNERHNVGFYRNVATSTTYWDAFKQAGYTDSEVMYDAYCSGNVYRSTNMSGIMWNNSGYFNAVSRHAIYERIIKQTETPNSNVYSWEAFLEYDKKNR